MAITPEQFKSAFPCFEMSEALANLGNNTMLLSKVISSFYENYKDNTISEITNLLDEDKVEEATRMAHTIKGLSGTIGAITLQKASLELELSCKENNPERIAAALEEFKKLFSEYIKAIEEGLETIKKLEE